MMDEKDLGVQPIDPLMTRLGVTNADLVRVSSEQLSFKMVQKARKGRRLTSNVQGKVLRALQAAFPEQTFTKKDLFNY